MFLHLISMWFSICIFCILHLHKKKSRVAFWSFLKGTTTLTSRNLPTTGASNTTSAPKFVKTFFQKNHLFMKTEHRTLQNLSRFVRIVFSKKSMFSVEKETAAPLLWYHIESISHVPKWFSSVDKRGCWLPTRHENKAPEKN